MNEQTKRKRGRPLGGVSHIGIQASDLAKYCANHPNQIVMVSRVFWEKKMAELPAQPQVEVVPENIGVIETNGETRVLGDMFMQTIPVNTPQIEMTLSE